MSRQIKLQTLQDRYKRWQEIGELQEWGRSKIEVKLPKYTKPKKLKWSAGMYNFFKTSVYMFRP